jgi:hypothetical protein
MGSHFSVMSYHYRILLLQRCSRELLYKFKSNVTLLSVENKNISDRKQTSSQWLKQGDDNYTGQVSSLHNHKWKKIEIQVVLFFFSRKRIK